MVRKCVVTTKNEEKPQMKKKNTNEEKPQMKKYVVEEKNTNEEKIKRTPQIINIE